MAKNKVGRKSIGHFTLKLKGASSLELTPGPQAIAWEAIRPRPDIDTRSLDPRHVLSLARSIAAVGLVQPVAIDTAGRLIAGAHRLAVWGLLRIADAGERRTAFLKALESYEPEDGREDPSEVEAMAHEIGELDITGWKDAHPKGLVPTLVFDTDSSKTKNKSLLREIAENEKRRSYTVVEVKALAERLKKAGFDDLKGRPEADQQSVRQELARILGKSSRQVRRYLNDPDATKPKVGHHVRLVARLKRLSTSLAKVQKDLSKQADAKELIAEADKLEKLIEAFLASNDAK
jgi:ParB family chromosome partitioning protein